MSSLSRKYARASRRGLRLMEQHQPEGSLRKPGRFLNPDRLGKRIAAAGRHRANKVAGASRRTNWRNRK